MADKKATETFILHLVKQTGAQNTTTFKQPGILGVRRKYVNKADQEWLQLVPGKDFSRTRQSRIAYDNDTPNRLQFADIHIHDSYPFVGAHRL